MMGAFRAKPRHRRQRLHGWPGHPRIAPPMGPTPTGVFASARHVTIVGHNSQIVPTVGFFVGGAMSVRLYTTDSALDAHFAPYPGVQVTVIDSYQQAPTDLPEPPYVVAVD